MTDLLEKLDDLHRRGKMHGFSIWPSQGGYQVSLMRDATTFRIRHGATPSEGVREVLDTRGPDELLEGKMLAPPAVDEPPLPEAGIFD